LRLTGVPVD
jgi:hypothetical protein